MLSKKGELKNIFFLVLLGLVPLVLALLKVVFFTPDQNVGDNFWLIHRAQPKPSATVTMIAVGDIMLSRHVGTKMFEAGDWLLPFNHLSSVLASADITVGNLESPFYDQGPRAREGMVFKAEPKAVVGLVKSGFDVLTLANNHILNQGVAGLNYTLNYLAQNNISAIGAGENFTAAHRPVIVEREGLKLAFLGYSYDGYNDQAGNVKPVVAGLDIEQMKKDVTAAKLIADQVIVEMHAGTEYTNQPNLVQQNFAHAAVAAGADLVIGHHPHWPQIVENYQGKWIFYSLGNFVFDQEWSQETKEGLMLQATWQADRTAQAGLPAQVGKLKELKLLPVVIENYSTPRLANNEEAARILTKINLGSPVIFNQ